MDTDAQTREASGRRTGAFQSAARMTGAVIVSVAKAVAWTMAMAVTIAGIVFVGGGFIGVLVFGWRALLG